MTCKVFNYTVDISAAVYTESTIYTVLHKKHVPKFFWS